MKCWQKSIGCEMKSILDRFIATTNDEFNAYLEQKFTEALRTVAVPPIKGAITTAKIKWRGIKRVTDINSGKTWLEQREKRITPKYKLKLVH